MVLPLVIAGTELDLGQVEVQGNIDKGARDRSKAADWCLNMGSFSGFFLLFWSL